MPARSRTPAKSKPNVFIPIAGLMIALVIIAAGVYWLRPTNTDQPQEPTTPQPSTVDIIINALPELAQGNRYALWLTVVPENGDGPLEQLLVGEFDGVAGSTRTEFQMTTYIQERAREALITLQTSDIPTGAMSPVVIARGQVERGVAALEFDGFDVAAISGAYQVGDDGGVVFFANVDDREEPLLVLPEVSWPWIYRAWVEDAGIATPIVSFSHPAQAVNMVGEEAPVIDPAAGNARVFISLDVMPQDTQDAVLSFELLQNTITSDSQPLTTYPLENVAKANLPAGLVVVR